MRVAVVINPISGTGHRPDVARARADLAERVLRAHGADGVVRITEGPGHARVLAAQACADGADLVVAWGGDGTVNDVGSVLAFGRAALGVVPSGSGNGLAREFRVPFDPAAALAVALTGRERLMDAGELDGRLFFNVSGLGLDARVAHRFAAGGFRRRGLARYAAAAVRELIAFDTVEYDLTIDGAMAHTRALLVAVANTQQYGNGARIAPLARPDDGRLDVVVASPPSRWAAVRHVPDLFTGRLAYAPGVRMALATTLEVASAAPILYHVDGEPYAGGRTLTGRVRPGALRIRVPH